MIHVEPTASVAEIVLEHPECGSVLRDLRIDFCCRGGLSLAAACAGKGLDVDHVVATLERAMTERAGGTEADPRALSTSELVPHILSRHHARVRRQLRLVERLAKRLALLHEDQRSELSALRDALGELSAALAPHLLREERVLFPELIAASPDHALVSRELAAAHKEHLRLGEMVTCIRTLADDVALPDWASASHRVLMDEVGRLEASIASVVLLENHVLLPRFARAASGRDYVEALRLEHGNIARLLLVLESHLARMHQGEVVDHQLTLDAVSFLVDYVDGFHHAREDLVIELLAAREPLARALLPTLSAQRETIHLNAAALGARLRRAALDEAMPRAALVREGFAYCAELRRTMALEEQVIFPLAAVGIDDSEWRAIDEKLSLLPDPRAVGVIDERYGASFEEITQRAGCDCSFARAGSRADAPARVDSLASQH